MLPNQQAHDFSVSKPGNDSSDKRAAELKSILEKNKWIQIILVLFAFLGTSMVIGDGILTPCISGNVKMKFFRMFMFLNFLCLSY